jgi:hypothetical protein
MVGIDLTPPQEIKKQKTQYVVGFTTIVSILIFLVLAGVGSYYFYRSYTVKNQIAEAVKQSDELAKQRESMKGIEDYSKRLSGKFFVLQKYLKTRVKYSSVMLEIISRVPNGLTLESIGMESGSKRARLTGASKDVVQVSAFVNRLAKEGKSSSESSTELDGKKAFTDVRLESLQLDKESSVDYAVSFMVNEEAFLK